MESKRYKKPLNPKGVAQLCQAVLASGIKDMDDEFVDNPIALFYLDNGFKGTNFGIKQYRQMFMEYKKDYKYIKKDAINVSEFLDNCKVMTATQLAEHYGRTTEALRCFCYRKGIQFSCQKE